MRLVIVTGISGAGRTRAIRCLEDLGYYCVDNMPPALIGKFAEMCEQSQGKLSNVAIVVDVRGGEMFSELSDELAAMKEKGFNYEVLFLDASDEVLIKRYKESRRNHPLSKGRVIDGIMRERVLLGEIKEQSTHVIDTSILTVASLKKRMHALFSEANTVSNMTISVVSFGFKYGIPMDSDLMFDVRFLPNPFYIDELKHKTGNDKEVNDFIMQYEVSKTFFRKLSDMVKFLIPQYIEEGKGNLVIAIGCTGGHHRSVTLANLLGEELERNKINATVTHRDINKK
ncbi:MAG: RNase adapter RapZ [Clostridia bacterium]|nr:RNase adapter RapZ [Clostridia bacterium]